MAELPEIVSRAVERFGDSCAIRCAEGEMSFAALEHRVSQVAEAFRGRGLKPGERVATWLDNGPEHMAILFGGIRAGLTVCPLSLRVPAARMEEMCAELDAKLLVTSAEAGGATAHPAELFEVEPRPFEGLRLGSVRHAVAVYTSGSTGNPKPAILSYGNLFNNAILSNHNIDAGPGNTWLLSLPLYHVGGLGIVFRCLLDGGTIAIPEADEPLAKAIARYGVTHISVVATQLYQLLCEDADVSDLKCVLLGGGPAPEPLVAGALERGLPLYTTYGLTEMASQVTTALPGSGAERLRTSGKALDPDAIRLGPAGEIEVTGDCLFQGYLADGQLERPLTDGGWFRTGDLGKFDAAGYLRVSGRRDNMFISGGENIQPEEIEAALADFEGVRRAVAVPVESAQWGQRPVAFVEWDGERGDEAALRAFLESRLARFKIPDRFFPWPDDLDEGMKVSRTELRERAARLVGGV